MKTKKSQNEANTASPDSTTLNKNDLDKAMSVLIIDEDLDNKNIMIMIMSTFKNNKKMIKIYPAKHLTSQG
jgi:hypothetical protein